MSTIGVVGEALVDIFAPEGTTLQARPGGSPANVAVALARLGVDTRFLGRTSSDRWGAMLRDHLESQGVAAVGPVGDEPTAIAFVETDAAGQASYRFLWDGTADRMLDAAELEAGLEGLDAIHVGSVACVLEPGAGAIDTVLAPIDEGLVVSFDPNARPALAPDADAARRRMLAIADHAHIVKASDEDLAFLFPGHDIERAAWELLDGTQTHLVVVTHGAHGAEVLTPRFQAPVPPVTLGPVIDTVGAGDTFMAALLTALDERDLLTVPALKALDVTTAIELGRFGAEAAAIVVTRRGADAPARAQVPAQPGDAPGPQSE